MTGNRVVKFGENVTLYEGDCREILPTLDLSAVVTDPPYGSGFAGQPTKWQRRAGMTKRGWDEPEVHAEVQKTIDLVVSRSREIIIWGGNYFTLPPSRGWLVWTKPDSPPSMADLELAWTNYDMNSRLFKKSISSTNKERDLRAAPHSTLKPISIMEWSLDVVTSRSICDPFMGSGTTGVACAKTGRSFVGIEIDPEYFDTACRRIEDAMKTIRLF